MRTESGNWSWPQVVNVLFLVLWIVVQVASGFGFASFQPPPEFVIIAPAIVAIINLIIRYYHPEEPIARR